MRFVRDSSHVAREFAWNVDAASFTPFLVNRSTEVLSKVDFTQGASGVVELVVVASRADEDDATGCAGAGEGTHSDRHIDGASDPLAALCDDLSVPLGTQALDFVDDACGG